MRDGLSGDRLYTLSPRDRTGFLGLNARQVLVIGTAVVVGVLIASRTGATSTGVWPFLGAVTLAFLRVGGMPVVDAIGPGAVWILRLVRGGTRWQAPPPPALSDGPPEAGRPTLPPLPPPLSGQRLIVVDGGRYHPGARGNAVAVAHDTSRHTYAVTVRATALGGEPFALTEPAQQELLLAKWGDALSGFCQERSPVAWVRWAEFACPDDADEQRDYLAEYGYDDPFDPAVASYRAVLDIAGPMAMRHEVLVTVAVDIRWVRSTRRQDAYGAMSSREAREARCIDAVLAEVRLLAERMEAGGLVVSDPMGPDEVEAALATRMQPAPIVIAPSDNESAFGTGESPSVSLAARLSGWNWPAAGAAAVEKLRWAPQAARATWRSWVVDGTFHRAFWITEWPRMEVRGAWMAPLLVCGGGKRSVAVVFEPVPLRASQRAIERQATKLESDRAHRESKGFRVPADHRRATRAVEEREEELVAGYTELEYAGLVTISAANEAELDRRSAELVQLAAGCAVGLEPLNGRHDLAVAACLPMARALARAWVA